jgi:hypothetical protein
MASIPNKTAPKKTAAAKSHRVGPETYRGVRIQPVGGPSSFTREQIRTAVEAAIKAYADARSSGT